MPTQAVSPDLAVVDVVRTAEGRLRHLAEMLHRVFWIVAPDRSRVFYISPAYEEVWGRPCQVLLQDPCAWLEAVHEQDRAPLEAALARARAGDSPIVRFPEYRVVRPDGSIRWIAAHTFPILDQNGQVCHIGGFAEDITDRKQAEEALRQSETRFRALFEQSPDAVFILNEDDAILDANPAACRLLGYSRQELLSMDITAVIAPELRPPTGSAVKSRLAQPGPYQGIDVHRDGHRIPVEVEISRLSGGLALSVVRDITQRKQAEDEIRQQARRLHTLYHISQVTLTAAPPEAIAAEALSRLAQLLPCARASVIEFDRAADQARELAVYTQDRLVITPGITVSLRDHEPWVAGLAQGQPCFYTDLSTRPQAWPGPAALLAPEAHGLPGLQAVLLVPIAVQTDVVGALTIWAGQPTPFSADQLAIASEVAALLAVALRHARLHEQARRNVESKGRMLREVNHRVSNNLMAIIALLSAEQRHCAEMDGSDPPTILQEMINRVNGLAAVHRMLSASEWEPLLLSELTAQVTHCAIRQLPRDVHLLVDLRPSAVRVTANQAHNLALVINELVTNTLKHALGGRTTAHVAIRIDLKPDAKTVEFEFRDDGPGYPADVLCLERCNVGMDLVRTIVRDSLRGDLQLFNDGGAHTLIRFEANG
jgi:PAS domain S-box-containing protein